MMPFVRSLSTEEYFVSFMMTEEIKTVLGYLELPDGPIEIDYENIDLKEFKDPPDLFLKSLNEFYGKAVEIDVHKEDLEKEWSFRKAMVTSAIVHWIEHHRIPGEIVLMYESLQLGYNFKLICKAYKT